MRAKMTVPHRRQGMSILLNPLRRAALGLLVGFTPAAGFVRADDLPPPMPAHAVAGVESDGFLLKKVNAALAADPVLSRIDLTVSVVDRVAVIGGPVPDAAVNKRVETIVNTVPGLAAVKVSCWSLAADRQSDPFAERLADHLKGRPGPQPPIPPAVAANPVVPPLAHTLPFAVPTTPRAAEPPVIAVKPPVADDAAPRTAAKVTVDKPMIGGISPTDGFLLDPVAIVRRPLKGGVGEPTRTDMAATYPTIPPPSVPVLPVSDVRPTADRVAAVKATDPRFTGLTVSFKDGTAVIRGKPGRAKDAWAFAEALRAVPGLARVIVRDAQ